MSPLREVKRTPLPIPATQKARIELLAAAGFTAEEVAAMARELLDDRTMRLAWVSENIVNSLAEFTPFPPGSTLDYDLRVPHDDPLRLLAEMSPEKKAELRSAANMTFADFMEPAL